MQLRMRGVRKQSCSSVAKKERESGASCKCRLGYSCLALFRNRHFKRVHSDRPLWTLLKPVPRPHPRRWCGFCCSSRPSDVSPLGRTPSDPTDFSARVSTQHGWRKWRPSSACPAKPATPVEGSCTLSSRQHSSTLDTRCATVSPCYSSAAAGTYDSFGTGR